MSLSPARQHRLRVQAEQAAREGGSVRHASGYDLMLLQLAETAAVSRAFSPRSKKRKSRWSCCRNMPPGRRAFWLPEALNRMTC